MGEEVSKKPKVLKRKGREVEEALLFEDQMDEAALEEWERKMGLEQEQEPQPFAPGEQAGSSQEVLQEFPSQSQTRGEPEDKVVATRVEPSWLQSGRLRWLGLAGVRLYLEEKGPAGKHLLLLGVFFLILCLTLGTVLLVFLKPQPGPTPQEAEVSSPETLLELMVPLRQGRAGLILSVSLELDPTGLQSSELRKELFQLISQMDPEDLSGPQGMERLRASMAEKLSSRWPSLRKDGIKFLQYLLL